MIGRVFILFHGIEKIAAPAVGQLLRIGTLDLSAAERSCDHPARTPGVFTAMGPVQVLMNSHRTYAELLGFRAAGKAAAVFVFPAILSYHTSSPALDIFQFHFYNSLPVKDD